MIQLARPQDMNEVIRLSRQIHELHVHWRPDIYEPTEERFSRELYDQLIQSRELYVAVVEDRVVGYVLMKFRKAGQPGIVPRNILSISEFCVDERFQCFGIGTQMLNEVKILAKAFGCTDLELNVYPQNDVAISFYQKNGLTIQNIKMQTKL